MMIHVEQSSYMNYMHHSAQKSSVEREGDLSTNRVGGEGKLRTGPYTRT